MFVFSLSRCIRRAALPLLAGLLMAGVPALAQEGPPSVGGVITNPTLVKNASVAKAQAVGAVTSFMSQGAKKCDRNGENCRNLFGADDNMDFASVKFDVSSLLGVESYSFLTENDDSGAVATQMGTIAIACGDARVKQVSGLAIKLLDCAVGANGNAQMTVQVCTAPERGNPVSNPENAVPCSSDPSAPNFTAPPGSVCLRPACDTEPVGSLDGWSAPKSVTWLAAMAESAPQAEKDHNGLALVFYPEPGSGTILDYSTDSDNMTAVKIVQSFRTEDGSGMAVGMRVAYRHKLQVTKEMLTNPSAVTDPGAHTSQWDVIEKLQSNPVIPQYQAQFAQKGTECLNQVQEGIATDGTIYVCEQGFSNESGLHPIALSAQVAAEGQDCGAMPQCLKEVVNTNSWTEVCRSDVPIATRSCDTKTDFTMEHKRWVRTRTQELCHEKRVTAEYSCNTWADPANCHQYNIVNQGGFTMIAGMGDTKIEFISSTPDGLTGRYLYGTIADNYWDTGYYSRVFFIDIQDVEDLKKFELVELGFDDEVAIMVNDQWVYADYDGGYYNAAVDKWGKDIIACVQYGEFGVNCEKYGPVFQTNWERNTSWHYETYKDLRPFMKTGRNVLRIDTGVVDKGEGWAYFDISAYKTSCDTIVRNTCTTYENAK